MIKCYKRFNRSFGLYFLLYFSSKKNSMMISSIKWSLYKNNEMKFLRFNGTKEFKTEKENNVIYRLRLKLKFFCRV